MGYIVVVLRVIMYDARRTRPRRTSKCSVIERFLEEKAYTYTVVISRNANLY